MDDSSGSQWLANWFLNVFKKFKTDPFHLFKCLVAFSESPETHVQKDGGSASPQE